MSAKKERLLPQVIVQSQFQNREEQRGKENKGGMIFCEVFFKPKNTCIPEHCKALHKKNLNGLYIQSHQDRIFEVLFGTFFVFTVNGEAAIAF